MLRTKSPVLFRKIIAGISSGKQNKLYSASAAMVHHPDTDNNRYASIERKQIKQTKK